MTTPRKPNAQSSGHRARYERIAEQTAAIVRRRLDEGTADGLLDEIACNRDTLARRLRSIGEDDLLAEALLALYDRTYQPVVRDIEQVDTTRTDLSFGNQVRSTHYNRLRKQTTQSVEEALSAGLAPRDIVAEIGCTAEALTVRLIRADRRDLCAPFWSLAHDEKRAKRLARKHRPAPTSEKDS